MAPDRLFGSAVAVDRRGVDPIDAGGDRADERGMTGRLVGVDQDPAGDAAAERQLRYLQPGAPEHVLAHCFRLHRLRRLATSHFVGWVSAAQTSEVSPYCYSARNPTSVPRPCWV